MNKVYASAEAAINECACPCVLIRAISVSSANKLMCKAEHARACAVVHTVQQQRHDGSSGGASATPASKGTKGRLAARWSRVVLDSDDERLDGLRDGEGQRRGHGVRAGALC